MKFLYVGDPHDGYKSPKSRVDDFDATYKAKREEIKQLVLKHDVKAILQPGDFLDRPILDQQTLMEVFNAWSFVPIFELTKKILMNPKDAASIGHEISKGIPIIGAIGNHELIGEAISSYPKTSLATLEKMGLITLPTKDEPFVFTDDDGTTIAITSGHYHGKMDMNGHEDDYIVEQKGGDFHVHLAHGFLTDKSLGDLIKHTTLDKVAPFTMADLTIAGHDHIGFGLTEFDGKQFINPGSLTRTKADKKEIRRRPKVLLVEVTKANGVVVTPILLKSALKGSDVLSREYIEAKQVKQSSIADIKSVVNKAQMKQGSTIKEIIRSISQTDGISESITDEVVEEIGNKMEQWGGNKKIVEDYHIVQTIFENFQSHKYTVLNFHKGLNVLLGDTARGKSALLRGIYWVTENKGNDQMSFIHSGEKFAKVTLVLSNGYKITRLLELSKTGNSIKRNGYEIYNPHTQETEFANTKFGEEVSEMLGFNKITYDVKKTGKYESKEEIDVNSLKQGEGWFFLGKTGSEKAKIIGSIFGTHYTDSTIREYESLNKKNEQSLKLLTKEHDSLIKEIESFDYLQDMKVLLVAADKRQASISKKVAKLEKLETLRRKSSSIELEIENNTALVKKLEGLDVARNYLKELSGKTRMCTSLEALLKKAKVIYNNGVEARQIIESTKNLGELCTLLNETKRKQELLDTIVAKQKNLNKINSQYGEAKQKYLLNEKQRAENIDSYTQLLEHAKVCPTCHSTVDSLMIKRIVDDFNKK